MPEQKPRSAEMHPGPGFRIRSTFSRPDPMLVRQFQDFDTPDISDQLNRLYTVDSAIHCMTRRTSRLCGPVVTVKIFPGDNLMVHKALDIAKPGDIVVVDGSSSSTAVLGDLISTKAKHRGIAGFVVDGKIRDLPGILPLDLPVFARGQTPVGPLHRGPGEINYPICCGGIVTYPGDILVADQAGIVVIRQQIAVELLRRLRSFQAKNADYVEAVRRGEFSNAWVDRVLEDGGCIVGDPEFDAIVDQSEAANLTRIA